MKDFTNMTPEEFNNLSRDDKKEYLRKLIHSTDEAAEIHAAFYNPQTGENISVMDLVEQIGEDKALDAIVEALEHTNITPIRLTEDKIKELIEKDKKGLCSEEEKHLIEFLTQTMAGSNRDNHIAFQNNMLDMVVNLIDYAQRRIKYQPVVADVLSATAVMLMSSGFANEGSYLSKYNNRNDDIEIVTEMCDQIGNDIYDTWKESCETLPDAEIIVLSLLHLACKISLQNDMKLASAIEMAKDMGIELDTVDENENGSNEDEKAKVIKPIVYNPDEDMRDLLKD